MFSYWMHCRTVCVDNLLIMESSLDDKCTCHLLQIAYAWDSFLSTLGLLKTDLSIVVCIFLSFDSIEITLINASIISGSY